MNDPNVVSPGILGFLAFFFLAVALFLLLRNMNGHLRRMRYRAEQEGRLDDDKKQDAAGGTAESEPEPPAPATDGDPDRPAQP